MKSRYTDATTLPGATEFSEDRDILSPVEEVKRLKQTAWLFNELDSKTRLDKNWGRKREPGSWALAYYAFTVSKGYVDVEPWWTDCATLELWQACGFSERPSYQTTYERFKELESCPEAFAEVAASLIQHCRRHDERIGAHIHVDGTEAETHAALVHDCQAGEGCARTDFDGRRPAQHPLRQPTSEVADERHKEAELPPSDAPNWGDASEMQVAEDGRKRYRIGGCWYRSNDPEAGIRAYARRNGKLAKFWHGYYNIKAVDHFTGAVIGIGVYSASRNEHLCYPDLLERVQHSLGANPETVIADRGFSVRSVFEQNTCQGIASVMPWRMENAHDVRRDLETHDRHGIPRCKHCGAESDFVRFRVDRSGPRLWFHCSVSLLPECNRDQSISCNKDFRLLNPLWRNDELYHVLKESHSQYERVQATWRLRYGVGGDCLANRPKRKGRRWQELRAQAALLAEWMRVAGREGWLGSARRNRKAPKLDTSRGRNALARLLAHRRRHGLNNPYGEAAAAFGFGLREPPSARSLGPPRRGRPPAPPPAPPPSPPPGNEPPF